MSFIIINETTKKILEDARNYNPRPPKKPKKNKMKLRNIFLALKDQLPVTRLLRNLWKGHVFGLFHERSHLNANGNPKVMYNTKASATKAALAMSKKRGVYFSNYKCMRCDGFHIGKNSENKG